MGHKSSKLNSLELKQNANPLYIFFLVYVQFAYQFDQWWYAENFYRINL